VPRAADVGPLITLAVIQGSLGLAVAGLLSSLHRLTRDSYLVYWAVAWVVLAGGSFFGAAALLHDLSSVATLVFGLAAVVIGYLQAPALALAALSLKLRRPPGRAAHWLLGAGTLAGALLLVALATARRLPPSTWLLVAFVPNFLLVAVANAVFAWSFGRHSPRSGTPAGRIVVAFGVMYALHLLGVGVGWAGIDLYRSPTLSAIVGLLLPMGITSGIVLSVLDDARESARSLRESEATKRAMLEAIPDALFVIDREGVFRDFLPAKGFETLVPPEQFLGRRVEEVLPSDVAAAQPLHLAQALETGETQAYDYALTQSGEKRSYEVRLTASGTERGIAIVRDVTRRQRAEAAREALIADLELKIAELERFTYTVSHDLKSPLTTIAGFTGFVERDAREGRLDRLAEDIQRIRQATARMARLLSDLLTLSRVGRIVSPPEVVPFEAIVGESIGINRAGLDARSVELHVAPDLPSVCGDRTRLVEVVQNLIANAVKFMGEQARPRIDIGVRTEAGTPVFFVRDNGIGIDPRYQERVFSLFEQLDPGAEGTGIGLALTKRIIEAHGGRIWVESAGEGGGSTFCFTLPTESQAAR
jgi:two-component system sensor kinase FixL